MDFSLLPLIAYLNTWPPEAFWGVELLCCYSAVLVMLRFFGKAGVYVFIAVSIIGANIQVLKVVKFSVFHDPVTLGTVLITSTYLAADILTEYYGARAARKGVFIGFSAIIMMLLWMFFGLSFRPITQDQALLAHLPNAFAMQGHLEAIFIPVTSILCASLISYLVSELSDVWIFSKIKQLTGVRFLWLRTNVSTLLGALLDNIVFNILAWRLFTAYPVPWHALIFTYILGIYVFRVVISILDTPFIYLAKYCIPVEDRSRGDV